MLGLLAIYDHLDAHGTRVRHKNRVTIVRLGIPYGPFMIP